LALLPLPAALLLYSFAPLQFGWLLVVSVPVTLGAFFVQAALGARAAREPVARWPAVLGFVLTVLVLNVLGRVALQTRLGPFRTPSESMSPTLVSGDQFYVLTDAARFPVERGSVIVHHDLASGLDYVRRVVALEGDLVDWDGHTLTINGKALARGACEADAPAGCHTEQLGRHRWRVLLTPNAAGPTGSWEVPAGQVFAMGDNRDNSLDSRISGAVPLNTVKGVTLVIYFSWPAVSRTGRTLDLPPE
jgi:signal peptidase I